MGLYYYFYLLEYCHNCIIHFVNISNHFLQHHEQHTLLHSLSVKEIVLSLFNCLSVNFKYYSDFILGTGFKFQSNYC